MKLFIGLDVSLAKTAVCVINEHGKIVKKRRFSVIPKRSWILQTPWRDRSLS